MSNMDDSTFLAAVHTYHCLCSHFLMASSLSLDKHKQRAGESLDKAMIVPVVSADILTPRDNDMDETGNGKMDVEQRKTNLNGKNASVLLNTMLDRKPVVVRRSDGFETRYQRRCGRCDLVIGYHLDGSQFGGDVPAGRVDKVVYILPGSLKSTQEMQEQQR